MTRNWPAYEVIAAQLRSWARERPVPESAQDGYQTRVARGYTIVEVNVPPATTRRQDLFVVTCRYDPGVRRTQGQ